MQSLSKTLILISLLMLAGQAMATSINQKQHNQRKRIAQGVATGELTRKETKRLVNGQRELNRMQRRAKSDGVVTPKERARLQGKARLESAKIAKSKHDRQKRR